MSPSCLVTRKANKSQTEIELDDPRKRKLNTSLPSLLDFAYVLGCTDHLLAMTLLSRACSQTTKIESVLGSAAAEPPYKRER